MKNFFLNVLQGLVIATIIATATLLWTFNTRLSRIEARLETIAPVSHAAASHQIPSLFGP